MIGIFTVLGFITISIISGVNGGEGGILIGIAGIILFLLSIFGFILSYRALKQKDIYYRFPMTGLITSGLMMIVFVILYMLGIASQI